MTPDEMEALIAEARRFDATPAEYAIRLKGAHSLVDRLADALEAATTPMPDEVLDEIEERANALLNPDPDDWGKIADERRWSKAFALVNATPALLAEVRRLAALSAHPGGRIVSDDEMDALIDSVAHDIVEHRWPHIDDETFEELRQAHLGLAEKIVTDVLAAPSAEVREMSKPTKLVTKP